MAIFKRTTSEPSQPTDAEIKRLLLKKNSGNQSYWLWQTDASRKLVNVTNSFASAFDKAPEQINGIPLLQVLAGPAWETGSFSHGIRLLAEKLKSEEDFHDVAVPVTIKDGERWWDISATPRHGSENQFYGYIGIVLDISEERAIADRMNRLVRFDTVTGLPNRMFINEALERACQESLKFSEDCCLRIIAVTNLNEIKTRFGYVTAERILSRISESLALSMNDNVLVGNFAPGEFAIIWNDASDKTMVFDEADRAYQSIVRKNLSDLKVNIKDLRFATGDAWRKEDGDTASEMMSAALSRVYRGEHSLATTSRLQVGPSNARVESRADLVSLHISAISAGIETLITEHRKRLHNGPPEAINEAELTRFQELREEIENMVVLAEEGGNIEQKVGLIDSLSRSVFRYSHDTGELFVAGLKPFLASVPLATGTLVLLQAICAPAVGAVIGPGAALAVLAGYYGIEASRAN